MYICVGGSLKAVISQDECLSDDVVREFAMDLLKGLKYIHDSGIVLSDFSPTKVCLYTSDTMLHKENCIRVCIKSYQNIESPVACLNVFNIRMSLSTLNKQGCLPADFTGWSRHSEVLKFLSGQSTRREPRVFCPCDVRTGRRQQRECYASKKYQEPNPRLSRLLST